MFVKPPSGLFKCMFSCRSITYCFNGAPKSNGHKVVCITSKCVPESECFLRTESLSIMEKPQLLLMSSSSVHGFDFLQYASEDIQEFLQASNVSKILFIPYALMDHDAYLAKVGKVFNNWGYEVEGIHRLVPISAVRKAEAIFIGGGNTFLLLKTLYELGLLAEIRNRVLIDGIPYMGSSAGTNVAAQTIHNTNDMPIVYPPSFTALQLIPFNINPHYLDSDLNSTHKGETREERILQYHQLPNNYPVFNVLGLREGCTLLVNGQVATLRGLNKARLFIRGKLPEEVPANSDLSFLCTDTLPQQQIALQN